MSYERQWDRDVGGEEREWEDNGNVDRWREKEEEEGEIDMGWRVVEEGKEREMGRLGVSIDEERKKKKKRMEKKTHWKQHDKKHKSNLFVYLSTNNLYGED